MDTKNVTTEAAPTQAESPAWAEKLLDEYHSAIFHFSVGAFPQRAVDRIKTARKALLQALTVPKVADEADDFPTVLDLAANAALAGILASRRDLEQDTSHEQDAQAAYKWAGSMMAARKGVAL